MARNTVVKNEQYPMDSKSDPLAELSRIMGLESRGGRATDEDVDFGIDLEKELLGDFEAANAPQATLAVDADELDALFEELAQEEDEIQFESLESDNLDFAFDDADFNVAEGDSQAEIADFGAGEHVVDQVASDFSVEQFLADAGQSQEEAAFARREPVAGKYSGDTAPSRLEVEPIVPTAHAVAQAQEISFEDELGELLGEVAPVTAYASGAAVVESDSASATDVDFELGDLNFDQPLDQDDDDGLALDAAHPAYAMANPEAGDAAVSAGVHDLESELSDESWGDYEPSPIDPVAGTINAAPHVDQNEAFDDAPSAFDGNLEFELMEEIETVDEMAPAAGIVEPLVMEPHAGQHHAPQVEAAAIVDDEGTYELADDQLSHGSPQADHLHDTAQDELDAAIADLEDDAGWTAPNTYEPVVQGAPPPVTQNAAPQARDAVEPVRPRFTFVEPEAPVAAAQSARELADDPFAALAAMAAAPPILRTLKRTNPVAISPEPVKADVSASAYARYTPPPAQTQPAVGPSVAPAATAMAVGLPHRRSDQVETPVASAAAAAEPEFDVADFDLELESNDIEAFAVDTTDWQIQPSMDVGAAAFEADQPAAVVEDEFADAFDITAADIEELDSTELDELLVDDFVSDLETIEVQDNVVAMADDLDLPELQSHADPHIGHFDDFDADFADAFRQLGDAKRPETSAVAAGPVVPQSRPSDQDVDAILDADFAAFQRDFEASSAAFDDANDFDLVPGADPQDMRPRSRMPLYGAIFLGFLLFAGAGAYALGMFGSSEPGVPALVRADATPVKVKPETPGGVVVPNQDGKVYERVAGVDPKAPSQEKLVSKVEEPIVPRARPVNDPLPGVESNAIKSEERVIAEAAAATPADEQAIGIAPKKVRTMVVRPDGTLAPRPEPVAAPIAEAPAAKVVEPIAAQPAEEAAKPVDVAATKQEQEVAASQPVAQKPSNVEQVLAPKPVKTTTITPKQAPEPKPEPKQVAAAPVPALPDMAGGAAAATGSAWNVQIASQPTRDGAQSSYETLARKYGSVIGGKGVNIVQANIEGKGTMWRVRIPAASKSDANILCAKLKTAGGSCFVSR